MSVVDSVTVAVVVDAVCCCRSLCRHFNLDFVGLVFAGLLPCLFRVFSCVCRLLCAFASRQSPPNRLEFLAENNLEKLPCCWSY